MFFGQVKMFRISDVSRGKFAEQDYVLLELGIFTGYWGEFCISNPADGGNICSWSFSIDWRKIKVVQQNYWGQGFFCLNILYLFIFMWKAFENENNFLQLNIEIAIIKLIKNKCTQLIYNFPALYVCSEVTEIFKNFCHSWTLFHCF